MSRVRLAEIPALTFYQDAETKSRRSPPIDQLACVGQACKLYQPDVVRCENLGDIASGVDVDWKCEADLPSSLRFGRVEVSCEGWSGPGDPFILKGSCGLTYRLQRIDSSFEDPAYWKSKTKSNMDIAGTIFTILWIAVLAVILYSFLKSCMGRTGQPVNGGRTPLRPWPWGGGGYFNPGGSNDDNAHPPPYSYKAAQDSAGASGWRPGFWSGAALGGLGASLLNRNRDTSSPVDRRRAYDWEDRRTRESNVRFNSRSSAFDDRGEGTSNLGSMRRSTGLGGSSVR